ncbi:hypothetical protein ACNQVK_02385 [Mycobacterium sp. 134]
MFTVGDETPECLAEPSHVNLLSLNEIANYDRSIVAYLEWLRSVSRRITR